MLEKLKGLFGRNKKELKKIEEKKDEYADFSRDALKDRKYMIQDANELITNLDKANSKYEEEKKNGASELRLEKLKEKYSAEDSGIELAMITGGWCLAPKKEYWDVLKEFYGSKREGRLSKSAMETLAIIAYSQPITRAEIEQIRGVGVDNMIRLLIERNLIKEVGKKEAPGRPTLFGTTKEFLKLFRLNSIAELPKLDEDEQERFELAR